MQKYRQFDRVPFFGEVEVRSHDGSVFLGRYWASDLSETGLFLQTTDDLPVGERLSLTMVLNGTTLRVHDAEVSWVRRFEPINVTGEVPGIGVRFTHLSDVVHDALHVYLQTQLEMDAGHDTLPPSLADDVSLPNVATPATDATDVMPAPQLHASELPSLQEAAAAMAKLHPSMADVVEPVMKATLADELDAIDDDEPSLDDTEVGMPQFDEIYTSLPPLRTYPPAAAASQAPVPTPTFGTDLPSLRPLSMPPLQSSPLALDDTLNDLSSSSLSSLPSSDGNTALNLSSPPAPAPRRRRPTLVPTPAVDLDATSQEVPRPRQRASVVPQHAAAAEDIALDATAQEIPSLRPLHVDPDAQHAPAENPSAVPAKVKDTSGWTFRVVSRARPLPEQSVTPDVEPDISKTVGHDDITSLNANLTTEDNSAIDETRGHADELLDAMASESGPHALGASDLPGSENHPLTFSGAWFADGERKAAAGGLPEQARYSLPPQAANDTADASDELAAALDDSEVGLWAGGDSELDDTAAQLLAGTLKPSALSELPQLAALEDKEPFEENDHLSELSMAAMADVALDDTAPVHMGHLNSDTDESEAYVLGSSLSDANPLSQEGETAVPHLASTPPSRFKGPLLTIAFLALGAAAGVGIALLEDGSSTSAATTADAVVAQPETAAAEPIKSVAEAEADLPAMQPVESKPTSTPRKVTSTSTVRAQAPVKVAAAPVAPKAKPAPAKKTPAVAAAPAASGLPFIEHKRVTVALQGGQVVRKFGLDNPPRVVVDLEGATMPKKRALDIGSKGVAKIRFGRPVPERVRVVVELSEAGSPKGISVLKKDDSLAVAWR